MITCVGVIVVSEHSMPMLMSGDGRISQSGDARDVQSVLELLCRTVHAWFFKVPA